MIYRGMIAPVVSPQRMVLLMLRLGGGPVRPGMEVSVEADGQPGCRLAKRTAADDPEPRRQAIRPGREEPCRGLLRDSDSRFMIYTRHTTRRLILLLFYTAHFVRSQRKKSFTSVIFKF